jgi:phosphate transport system substrate-binding protein
MSCLTRHKQALLWRAVAIVAVLGGGRSALEAGEPPPAYEKVSGLEGNLSSIGSDTLNSLMTHWAEAFRRLYPNVQFQIQGTGSATAPPAIGQGVSQLGPISRKMKSEEEDAFERTRGFKPTCLSVALDCVAVYVHQDNPINGLTMAQLDSIFSKTHKSGLRDMVTWGDVGLTGVWAKLPISLYGRNASSGTYAFFRQNVLLKGEYKDTVKEQPGSAAVVQGVASDRAGIGYSGIGYKIAEVRVVPLAKTEDYPFIEATFANSLAGSYPLGRTLYIYVAKRPGERLPRLNEEFFRFVLSKDGQEIAVRAGYGALPHDEVAKQLELLK